MLRTQTSRAVVLSAFAATVVAAACFFAVGITGGWMFAALTVGAAILALPVVLALVFVVILVGSAWVERGE